MIQQGMVLCHCHTDGYKHVGGTHHIKPPERKLERERGGSERVREWERDLCQIGKHLSSISVTTQALLPLLPWQLGDCQASWGEGWCKKSADVTYFRSTKERERENRLFGCCIISVQQKSLIGTMTRCEPANGSILCSRTTSERAGAFIHTTPFDLIAALMWDLKVNF